MLFNSYEFLFLFLPITFFTTFLFSKFLKKNNLLIILIFFSLIFYSIYKFDYLIIFISSIFLNYFFSRKIISSSQKNNLILSKTFLFIGLLTNLIPLFVFKYYDFFIENISNISGLNSNSLELIMPIGISFYTFQQIGYLVDCFKNKNLKTSLVEYVFFVSFFPQLIAGPIVHHDAIIGQIKSKKYNPFSYRLISLGLPIFILGLAKKIIIADNLSTYSNILFDNVSQGIIPSTVVAWIGSLSYTLQIYFDFSAYSDMAIGLGLFFGIKIPVNFDSPYKSQSIIEFWNRWHITLSTFIKEYLYTPLIIYFSKRNGFSLTKHLNAIVLSMVIAGLWHGANWTFIIWGLVQGLALGLNHLYRIKGFNFKLNNIYSRILLLFFINLSWVIFRSESIKDTLIIYKSMFSFNLYDYVISNQLAINLLSLNSIIKASTIIIIFIFISQFFPSTLNIMNYKKSDNSENDIQIFIEKIIKKIFLKKYSSSIISIIFFICIAFMYKANEFLYFQF